MNTHNILRTMINEVVQVKLKDLCKDRDQNT